MKTKAKCWCYLILFFIIVHVITSYFTVMLNISDLICQMTSWKILIIFSTFLLILWKFHQNYYKQLKVCDISSMNQSKVNYIMDQSCDCLVNIT